MKSLREDVCQLLRGVNSNQTKMTVLDCLVGEVLADVNVLRPPMMLLPHSMHALLSS